MVSFDGDTQGAADRPLEVRTAKPPLDQVIGRSGLHRPDIHLAVTVAREHDDRRAAAAGNGLPKQFEARPRSQMVIQETQLVATDKSVSIAVSYEEIQSTLIWSP